VQQNLEIYIFHKTAAFSPYQLVATYYLLLSRSPTCFGLTYIGHPQGIFDDICSVHLNLAIRFPTCD